MGPGALGKVADVIDPDDVARVFDLAVDRWGEIDVSVHNAGIITISRLEDLKLETGNGCSLSTPQASFSASRPRRPSCAAGARAESSTPPRAKHVRASSIPRTTLPASSSSSA